MIDSKRMVVTEERREYNRKTTLQHTHTRPHSRTSLIYKIPKQRAKLILRCRRRWKLLLSSTFESTHDPRLVYNIYLIIGLRGEVWIITIQSYLLAYKAVMTVAWKIGRNKRWTNKYRGSGETYFYSCIKSDRVKCYYWKNSDPVFQNRLA